MSTVVISVYNVANFTHGGGHLWVYMQYVQGLIRLGCDVYWLEQIRLPGDPGKEADLLASFFRRMREFGLEGKTLLYEQPPREGGSAPVRFIGTTRSDAEAVLRRADLLLNFHYAIDPRLLDSVRRTALVDIDPGLLQYWMSTGQLDVLPHDHYLTTGETVGTPAARFPDCGLRWVHIRPPVCLDLWPFTYEPHAEAFTTVSSWSTADWLKVEENGKTVLRENTKRVAFLEFAELPRHTSQPLELALYLLDRNGEDRGGALLEQVEHGALLEQVGKDAVDRARLERHGWRLRHSREVAGSPEAYRTYVQRSRGEFSCVKPSCVDYQNAWISDRTLCYLSSGKPVVVQHTGPSSFLPHGEGMFRFTDLHEAVEAFAAINAHYARHCRAARELAETYFDARKIMEQILNDTLGPDGQPGSTSVPADQSVGAVR